MDLVLGLSMESAGVRWVLVEGASGEGALIDRGVLDGPVSDVLDRAAVGRLHAVGLTWTGSAEERASAMQAELAGHGVSVTAVSAMRAAETLATGIAELTGYRELAVCLVEAEVGIAVRCGADGVTAGRLPGASAEEWVSVPALLDGQPQAVFVVGSGDVEAVTSALAAATDAPVITASEADFALARGVALAAAKAVTVLDVPVQRRPWVAPASAIASLLAAAVVTFVVSLSVAIGLRMTPEPQQREISNNTVERAQVAEAAPPAPLGPPPARLPAPEPAAPAGVAETIAVQAPPVPAVVPEPMYEPPVAAPVEPEPVYVPPAAPEYVPPPPPAYVPPAACVRAARPTAQASAAGPNHRAHPDHQPLP